MRRLSKYIISLLIILAVASVAVDAVGQQGAVKKIAEKTLKTLAKKEAKAIGKNSVKSARKWPSFTRAARTIMKDRKFKSYLQFSKNHSKELMAVRLSKDIPSPALASLKKPLKDFGKTTTDLSRHGTRRHSHIGKNGAEYLPKGKSSIRVKYKDGKYYPLHEKSVSDKAYDIRLLAEQRRSVSPYNQFPTKDQLLKYTADNMEFNKEVSSAVLKRNMFRAMDSDNQKIVEAFGGVQAHHVVPGNIKEANAARKILKKFDIDINSPENGIFLPDDKNSIFKGTHHKTSHSPEYCKYVYKQLKDCEDKNAVIEKLQKIKAELYSGKLPLNNNIIINKNIRVK